MQKAYNITQTKNNINLQELESYTNCIGNVLKLTKSGQAVVDFPGNPNGAIVARSILGAKSFKNSNDLFSMKVLLTFERGDPSLPIVVGLIHDELHKPENRKLNLNESPPKDVYSDGERLVFEANKEVVLRCGKGSITLRSDGKVMVKGTQIISRSSGSNKIKGATVNLN